MITKAQAKIGLRVKWQSLDVSIPPFYGKIEEIGPSEFLDPNEILIKFDDGETGSTYLDSGASRVFPA